MSQAKKPLLTISILLVVAFSFAACAGKAPVIQTINTPVDGPTELIWETPKPAPEWITRWSDQSDHEYLAFKGTSLDSAQQREAERLAREDAAAQISGYLFTRVDSQTLEVLSNADVTSSIYDPGRAEESFKRLISSAIVNHAYPSEEYIEYFKRYERGRWNYYYKVQMLMKYPLRAAQVAAQAELERRKAALDKAAQQEEDAAKRARIEAARKLLEEVKLEFGSQASPPVAK